MMVKKTRIVMTMILGQTCLQTSASPMDQVMVITDVRRHQVIMAKAVTISWAKGTTIMATHHLMHFLH